ncbi:MAG TPA: tetratricopeptide repeat protein, partial [Pyrinomonadaceae bacterium]|nr:tetratricopeptide repeat protein [Pyrinomonadaceae bacterium]
EAFKNVAEGIRRAVEEIAAPPESKLRANIPRPPIVGFVTRRVEHGRDIVGVLKEELAPEKRQLVALWGPGGAGKSTLAAEFVRATEEVFAGRVAWVSALGRAEFSLATLLDETATQLGREDLRKLAPEAKAAQVGALLSDAPALVVLDNFETIAEQEQVRCLDFLAQGAACPALVTTRSFIKRDDVYNVPLAAMSMEEAREFLRRLVGRTRKPANFDKLDRDDLIRRCEAIPLVLQWVVRQIDLAQRPQVVLDELEKGEGDAAERVFMRSYNLPQVGEDGRAALLALSLFTPDASPEALAEVAGFGDDMRRLHKAVENLSALWLIETTEGNERLFLRGLTRELAKSRLSKDDPADDARRRYVAHFLNYARAHRQVTAEDLDALEVEKDNLLGAMDTAFRMQSWSDVIRIRIAVEKCLYLRGYWDEAVKSAEQAETAARHAGSELNVAYFTACVAGIRMSREEYDGARGLYHEALEIFRKVGSEKNVAGSLNNLALIAQKQGDFEEARLRFDEAMEIYKMLEDQKGISATLHNLAAIAQDQGEFEEARRLCNESLEIEKSLKNELGIADTLYELGRLALVQGQPEEARRLIDESLEISRKLGSLIGIARGLYALGIIWEQADNKTEALKLYSESLPIYEKLGSPIAGRMRADLARVQRDDEQR